MITLRDAVVQHTFSCLTLIEKDEEQDTYYATVVILRDGFHVPFPLLDITVPSFDDAATAIDRVLSSDAFSQCCRK